MTTKGYQIILPETFMADANVSQHTALVQGASDYHATNPAGANASGFVGVAMDDAISGNSVPVCMMGTVWVQAAGAITAGSALVIANATGQVQAASGVTAPNVVGVALSTTTTAGDLVLMRMHGGSPQLLAGSVLKKVSGATNATPSTQNAYAHGLPYIPTTVLVTSKSNGVVYQSQAADATNIYLSGSAASLNFDAFVG